MKAEAGPEGSRKVTRTVGGASVGYVVRGDTAVLVKTFGKVAVRLACVRDGAGYVVDVSGEESGGRARLKGALAFDDQGAGSGEFVELKDGTAKPPVPFRSDPDGRTSLSD